MKEAPFILLSDVPRPLLATLRRLPGTRVAAWLVFEEDDYESRFGDGRFLYVRAAFLSEPEAAEFLNRKRDEDARRRDARTLGYLYSVKRVELVRDEAQDRLVGEFDLHVDERASLPDVVRLLSLSPTREA